MSFPLDVPGVDGLRSMRDSLRTQLSARLLPHLIKESVPALVVFGGSSGAGKSTLVNSILGQEVTSASVLRPTTRTPVLIYHPDDDLAMNDHALTKIAKVVVSEKCPPGAALIDAPDLDSIDEQNRALSSTLMNSADLWVFVTTAARYGDHVAWSALTEAFDAGLTVGVILNRLPARAKAAVRHDLLSRLSEAGMGGAPLFVIDDVGPNEGLLAVGAVAELRDWLALVARTHAESLVTKTTRALLPGIREELLAIADGAAAQTQAAADLVDSARAASADPAAKLEASLTAGRLASGAPTTRWLTLASSGGVLAPLVAGKKPLFASRGKSKRDRAAMEVASSIEAALRVALIQAVSAARDQASKAWDYSYVETDGLSVEVAVDRVVERAVTNWVEDSKSIAESASSPVAQLFSREGLAALIRSAAGGLAGAQKVLGSEGILTKAKASLVERSLGAVDDVTNSYVSRIESIDLPDSSTLRLRAAELANSWEGR